MQPQMRCFSVNSGNTQLDYDSCTYYLNPRFDISDNGYFSLLIDQIVEIETAVVLAVKISRPPSATGGKIIGQAEYSGRVCEGALFLEQLLLL